MLLPVPLGRPRRFSPWGASSPVSVSPVLGSYLRVCLMPVAVFSISPLWPWTFSPVFIPARRRSTSLSMSSQPSSTSFLAPAILSAKVSLSLGSAKAANFFCFGVILSSIGPKSPSLVFAIPFLPCCGTPAFFCKSLIKSSSEPWPNVSNALLPTFLAMLPTFLTTSPRPSSMLLSKPILCWA